MTGAAPVVRSLSESIVDGSLTTASTTASGPSAARVGRRSTETACPFASITHPFKLVPPTSIATTCCGTTRLIVPGRRSA